MMLGPAAGGEALVSLGTGTSWVLTPTGASALVGWSGEAVDAGTCL